MTMKIFQKIVKFLSSSSKDSYNRKNDADKYWEDFDDVPSDNFPYILVLQKTKISVH